jgi:Ca-activated chloride channel family protein
VSASPIELSLLGYAIRIAAPGRLWLLAAVALLAAAGAGALARRRAALRGACGPLAPRVAPEANLSRPTARLGLSLSGLLLLAVALAQPQCGTRTELAKRYGADVVVVLDVSRSMEARDVRPSRLERARLEVGALLDRLAGDRVGIVVFAGEAFVQCPLTTDYEAARLFLRAVGPDAVPQQGTAVANALLGARQLLEKAEGGARGRVVLLVSDGEDHDGQVHAAVSALAEAGIRVHVLAVGTPAGAPIPMVDARGEVKDWRRDRRGHVVATRLDEATLRLVADRGGGRLFHVGDPGRGLDALVAALDELERSELGERITVSYEDRYAVAAFPAFLLLLAGLLLREGRPAEPMPPAAAWRRAGAAASPGPSPDGAGERGTSPGLAP